MISSEQYPGARRSADDFNTAPVNYMTEETHQRILASIPVLEEVVNDANRRKGEAAGANADWHDNPAYDQAISDANVAENRLASAKARLLNVVIIESRTEVDVVGLGNTVVLRFEGEDKDETFVLLGSDDAQTGNDKSPRWVSVATPLGQAIIGQTAKTEVTVNTPDAKIKVKIKKILPGGF